MPRQLASQGELSTETLPCMYVEWKVAEILLLPQDKDHMIHSPSFQFKDATWNLCLIIHGQRHLPYDSVYDTIDLYLVRKYTIPSAFCDVLCLTGIKAIAADFIPSDRSDNLSIQAMLLKCWGTKNILRSSYLFNMKAILSPCGVVRFFCYFWEDTVVHAISIKQLPDDQAYMMANELLSENTGEILTEITTIMHVEWKIPDIRLFSEYTKHMLFSPSFQFKDETWYLQATIHDIQFRPLGICGPIDLHLGRKDCSTSRPYSGFKIGIKPVDRDTYKSRDGNIKFVRNGDPTLLISLLSRLDKRITQAPNGEVTFLCYFLLESALGLGACSKKMSEGSVAHKSTELTASSASTCTEEKPKFPSGISRLFKDFKNLFISGEDSDLSIKVKDKEFKAHKIILRARSSAFHSMLSHDMVEKNSGTIDITDCEPEAFKIFLLYLYNGCVEDLSTDTVFDLYRAADKYDAEEVKLKCKEFMLSSLSVDTVCDVVEHALLYDDAELLKTATEFFSKNFKNIILTVKWQSFLKKNTVAANELIIKASKYYVFKE